MQHARWPFWRLAARTFFVPVFAWLLVAQGALLPLAKVRASEVSGAGSALAVLCSTTLPLSGDGNEPEGKRIHDLGCSLVCGRFVYPVSTPETDRVISAREVFWFIVAPRS
jgi:hypothetical protein